MCSKLEKPEKIAKNNPVPADEISKKYILIL